ncbi:glycosyltransferase family 4 protein [Flavobacterium ardleyense]|uniref:Glycosyltransferase family 4 protein n=1 Tax=Flavobacterium ardleyense TaxID=2038737 RepID=A0ABW5ZBE4_9FLAO
MFKFYKFIFFSIPYHQIGGAERVHLNIIKSLKNKPFVFFDNCNSEEIGQEFKDSAYCFSIKSNKSKKYALQFIHVISVVFRVTLFGCNTVTFYNFIGSLKGKVKAIDLTHAFSFPEKGMEITSLPFVDLIDKRVVINEKTKKDYENLYKENHIDLKLLERIVIIPNGILISDFENTIESRFENFTIGFVGRNSQEKRPELFFDIVRNLNCKAKVIGDNFEIYKNDFPKVTYFENCNIPKTIREEFSTISVLIVSSSREGFPLVIMEAMELGIPVIATDVGNIAEHVINDKNGFVGPVDAKEFLNFSSFQIKKLINNKELYVSLSTNAREYAVVNFNIENFKIEYRKLFYE